MITALLIILLQSNKKGWKPRRLALIDEKRTAFRCLLTAFQSAPFLKHYNLNLSIKVEINTFKFTIADILF